VAIALLIAPGVNYMVRKFGFRVPLIIGTFLKLRGENELD
jgi:hypothetical protein